jgi:hypothetical protein
MCLRENVRQPDASKNIYSHADLKYYDKYNSDALLDRKISRKPAQENIEPFDKKTSGLVGLDTTYSTTLNRKYNCDIFTNAKSREERLHEIEKIRQNFAQSRNKTID